MRTEARKYKKFLNLGPESSISQNTKNFFVVDFFYFFELGLKSAAGSCIIHCNKVWLKIIAKCDRYYKKRQEVIKSLTWITKCDSYFKVTRNKLNVQISSTVLILKVSFPRSSVASIIHKLFETNSNFHVK